MGYLLTISAIIFCVVFVSYYPDVATAKSVSFKLADLVGNEDVVNDDNYDDELPLLKPKLKREASSSANDLSYEELFERGYMPYYDDSEVKPEAAERLKTIERCNIMMAEYLRKHKLQMTKSPPDLPVKVGVMFIVTNIYEVCEKDQTVTLTTFIELAWRDRRLLKATDDDCVDVSFTVPNFADLLWFPLWTIENSADRTMYHDAWEKFPIVIHNRSLVTWTTSFRIVLNCPMNMQAFPFDAQNCYILIRSPHFFIEDLQYYVYGQDQAFLLWNENVSNSLWSVTGQLARHTIASNISGLEVRFRMERRSEYYIWTLIMPTFLISMTTILAFILPSHSSEKLQSILSGILAYFLLLINLTEVTPQASENIPILTLFYVVVIAVGIAGSFACAIIVRMANSAKEREIKEASANNNNATPLTGYHRYHNGSEIMFHQKTNQHNINRQLSFRATRITTNKQQQPPSKTKCRCHYTPEQINNICLFIYSLTLCCAYVWLLGHTLAIRAQNIVEDARRYNYTAIKTF